MNQLSFPEAQAKAQAILDEVGSAVVGTKEPLAKILTAIIAGGHVLVEDYPGLGKTLAARSFAQALGLEFTRAQFTPDLLPADITGSYLFDQNRGEFVFREGPLFTGLLLADEINRTPPKTQAALLEAMQEKQVSVEGHTFKLPDPFHVIATANPVEHEGTYPLPEAQLDRFLLRISFGYPSLSEEWEVLERRISRKQETMTVNQVATAADVLALQRLAEEVYVHPDLGRYIVALTAATREHPQVLMGASPRGSLALLTSARAWALLQGRNFVITEDVQALAGAALEHRISVKPELWLQNVSAADIVADVVSKQQVPDLPNNLGAAGSLDQNG